MKILQARVGAPYHDKIMRYADENEISVKALIVVALNDFMRRNPIYTRSAELDTKYGGKSQTERR